jgi:hypothetical protein
MACQWSRNRTHRMYIYQFASSACARASVRVLVRYVVCRIRAASAGRCAIVAALAPPLPPGLTVKKNIMLLYVPPASPYPEAIVAG